MTTTLVPGPTKLANVAHSMNILALSCVWMLVVWFCWTEFYPFNPVPWAKITVVEQPRVGGEMKIRVDYCKTRDWVPSGIQWTLLNEVSVIISKDTFSLPVACPGTRTVSIFLSRHVVPATYLLQQELIYSPWAWRDIVYTRTTKLPFTILPALPEPKS